MRKFPILLIIAAAVFLMAPISAISQFNSTDGAYTVSIFNGTGIMIWEKPAGVGSVDILIIGGGGSSGGGVAGVSQPGFGGAGGALNGTINDLTGQYSIIVGAGGASVAGSTQGNNGQNSSFSNATVNWSSFGGGGGGRVSGTAGSAGNNGGSGGGGGAGTTGTHTGGTALQNSQSPLTGYGFAGGLAISAGGGGGGGCGGAGAGGATGNWGIGKTFAITGESLTYCHGGGVGAATVIDATGFGGNGTSSVSVAGSTGVVILRYLTPGGDISASFTNLPNPSETGETVILTDTSSGLPVTWNWSISGVLTNSTQNSAYKFTTSGNYPIWLNVTNASGYWSNTSATHTVINASHTGPQDIWMVPQYAQSFHVTSSYTLSPISNVTIATTHSGTATTDLNGNAALTTVFGAETVTFSAPGYIARTINYVFDADETHNVELNPSTDIQVVDIRGTPKDVKFHIQSFFGSPITSAYVGAQGVSTTTGSWDWLATLLSIDFGETPINNETLNGTTDSNGDIVFLMLDSIKYNITVTASGYTFPNTIISPQASQYTISANMNTSWFESGNDTVKEVNVSVSWVPKNATWAFVNISYEDDTGTTTGGNIKIYLDTTPHKANVSPIAVMNITSSNCSNSTLVSTPVGGASYTAIVNATTTGGNIVRTFVHSFKGAPVNLPGWTPETQLWLAVFILIFTAAFAGVIHAPQMSVVVCLEGWIFWSIGWLNYLISGLWYEEVGIVGILVVATAVTIFWSLAEGKAKAKRSS